MISIVVDAPLASAARLALADFEETLVARGDKPIRIDSLPNGKSPVIVVGEAVSSPLARKLLDDYRIDLSRRSESFCVKKLSIGQQRIVLFAGHDSRGLSYALLDASRALQLASAESDLCDVISEAVEAPYLSVRSMTLHRFNDDVDAAWYFDDEFWKWYFAQLALYRYNNLSLTFSDQTNYLNPIYAYLVDLPEFPTVHVRGLSTERKKRNLAMLQRISELAAERGIDFTLGIWMQAPVPAYDGEVLVENLPSGIEAAKYCAAGLTQVLRACPQISSVQFRMNAEAGVSEAEQTEFYRPLFQAIRACGRPVRLDLRYKGLQAETTRAAIDAGLDVTVSTKFWCEHLGLPYHPTIVDRAYRDSRYSFGTMLEYPRLNRVTFRLWSVGSQRLLVWGDMEYAARFARQCRLGDGEGFEVFAPLTNKGYGNHPGSWRIFADRSHESYRWEQERYWLFSLVFGRLGYNPDCDPEIWRREFRHRFGPAADEIEAAVRQAGKVLPLITATRLPSASEWRWWPEMDTGGALAEYMHTPASDPAQFYAIRSWRRTARWAGDPWDDSIPGYLEDAVGGRLRGKTTPFAVSRTLQTCATDVQRHLNAAIAQVAEPKSAEFIATERDLRITAKLAEYHAAKILAATHWAFFETTRENGRLPVALRHARAAQQAWEDIVSMTEGVYHDNLVFGILRNTPRSRLGQHHSGHWKDRLEEVRQDVAQLENLLKEHGGEGASFREFLGERPSADEILIEHVPPSLAQPGENLRIAGRVTSSAALKKVVLHYRRLDQTADWNETPMSRDADGSFFGDIPGRGITPAWDLQYYWEVLTSDGGRIWPKWEDGPPYVVVRVAR